jgi:hypothetical protein
MNYLDVDRPGSEYLPCLRGTIEAWEIAGLRKSRSPGFCGSTKARAKTSNICSRHGTSSVIRHRGRAKATDVSGSSLPLIYSVTF